MNKRIPVLLALLLLSGCAAEKPEPASEPTVEQVTMVVTADSIRRLEDYPELKKADLTGSTCYDALEAYHKAHADVDVQYTVSVGSRQADWQAQGLTLNRGEYSFDDLMEGLRHLPELSQLDLPLTELSEEQLDQLRKRYGNVDVECTVELLGTELRSDVEELDLSELTSEGLDEAIEKLPMLPKVQRVEMMDGEGKSRLSLSEVHRLQEILPDAFFHYSFELFGKTVSTDDESVEIVNRRIGDKGEEEARQALDILKNCKYFALDNCHFSNEVMAQMREDYRGRTKVVWRIFFANHGSCRTDRTVLRYVYNLYDYNCADLKYCEDAEYIDFGHNESLTDCSWVANMKNLKAIILSGSLINDLSAFENCENLEFLEIAYCSRISDLSPLKNCKNLIMLNTSFTSVEDTSPLDELPLERFCSVSSKIPVEEQERFQELHPDCLTLFRGKQPYGYCWRYHEDGCTPTDYYAHLKEVFGYPTPSETYW